MSNTASTNRTPETAVRPVLALTPGEPAGIGPDITLSLAAPRDFDLVLIADPAVLAGRANQLGIPFSPAIWAGQGRPTPGVYVEAVPAAHAVVPGQLDSANSAYVIACLKRAAQGCRDGEFAALITGPVHKGIINDAGIPFTGHTEFLAREAGIEQVVMMLAAPDLRVALATTHLPLSEVSRAITRTHLERVVRILHGDLKSRFGLPDPVILVCGLNPHAGEGGHIGREEIDVIEPVLDQLRTAGMKLRGPVPADTAFLPAVLADVDAVLAMYHDQGLPVLKHHDFAHAINITLGLPFVRTSVDHGTALELAGTGRADARSLQAAIRFAFDLTRRKTV
jgi:4-hydroxythreonine-4-phosphate dehydrogenase